MEFRGAGPDMERKHHHPDLTSGCSTREPDKKQESAEKGPILDRKNYENKWLKAFFEEIDVRVTFTDQRLWHSDGLRMFLPLPCKGAFAMPGQERSTLWNSGALFLRYPCAEDLPGYPSHIYLVDDKNYDLHSLGGHQRKETRRALRKCTVSQIPISHLYKEGFDLIRDTCDRQGRVCDDAVMKAWETYFRAAEHNPIFEAWAAFVGRELAAYRVDFTFHGGFYGEVLFNRRDLLKYEVMNALMFVSTKEAITRAEIDHVSYGMRGLTGESEALNRFKESMGYRKVVTPERIEVRPVLKPLFDLGLIRVVHAAAARRLECSAKAKRICGMIDTYLNQRKDCLAGIASCTS